MFYLTVTHNRRIRCHESLVYRCSCSSHQCWYNQRLHHNHCHHSDIHPSLFNNNFSRLAYQVNIQYGWHLLQLQDDYGKPAKVYWQPHIYKDAQHQFSSLHTATYQTTYIMQTFTNCSISFIPIIAFTVVERN